MCISRAEKHKHQRVVPVGAFKADGVGVGEICTREVCVIVGAFLFFVLDVNRKAFGEAGQAGERIF